VEIAANATLACPPWRRLKAVEFQCRGCSKPGCGRCVCHFRSRGQILRWLVVTWSFGRWGHLLRTLMAVQISLRLRTKGSAFPVWGNRRAGREGRDVTRPSLREKPDRFARRVGRPHRTRAPKITHSLGVWNSVPYGLSVWQALRPDVRRGHDAHDWRNTYHAATTGGRFGRWLARRKASRVCLL